MTAGLLRRAAEKLRTYANRAPDGPWVSLDDGDRLVALRPDSTFEDGFRYLVDEPIDDTSIAEYFALMHPPVAFAVASLLQLLSVYESEEVCFDRPMYAQAVNVARAVLREGGDQ